MQPLSNPRGVTGDSQLPDLTSHDQRSGPVSSAADPLTTAQRTTLERIMVKIQAISNLKAPELWAGLRHQAGVKTDTALLSSHFPAAEAWLTQRLIQEQNHQNDRRLLQQLTELLPQGNNRQAVSDYIRQQFGQTVLSALTCSQLKQVLTMLQQGQMNIPQPLQTTATDRSLLPAEHKNINQQMIKLSVASGESLPSLWNTLYPLLGLKHDDPIPSRQYPLIIQYLQARQALLTQPQPTVQTLLHSLKQPPSAQEVQYVTHLCQQNYQLPPELTLTRIQAQDLLNHLFKWRVLPMSEQNSRRPPPAAVAGDAPSEASSGWLSGRQLQGLLFLIALLLLVFWMI